MSTAMHRTRWRWWHLPALALLLGGLFGGAIAIGGDRESGLVTFAVLGAFAVVFALGGRSEAIRGLRGDGRDEYWQWVDTRATTFAGLVLIVLVLGMCVWEWAHGRDGSPYTQLGALAGLSYVVGLALVRWRG